METQKKFFTLLLACAILAACSKEEEPEPIPLVESDILGEWVISNFSMNGKNRTSELDGYTFEIFSNGDFVINKNTIDSYGSWEINEADRTMTVRLSLSRDPADVIEGAWQLYGKTEDTLWLKSFGQGHSKEFRLKRI